MGKGFDYADKYPHSVRDIPEQVHWVILQSTTRDDGYGGTDSIVQYEGIYLTEDKFLSALNQLTQTQKDRYIGICVSGVYKPITRVESIQVIKQS